MIDLNKDNGMLYIDDTIVHKDISFKQVEDISRYYNGKKDQNGENTLFSLTNISDGEEAITLYLLNAKLKMVSIFLGPNYSFEPFVISEEIKSLLLEKLTTIGGEKEYSWGRVEYFEDRKGGSQSIVITYF